MENTIEIKNPFALIKVLVVNNEVENNGAIFIDGMNKNYHLNHENFSFLHEDFEMNEETIHEDQEKYANLIDWEDHKPEEIDSFPVGTVFKGISAEDSSMRTYTIVGKLGDEENAKSIWFPIDVHASYVGMLSMFDSENGKFNPIAIEEIEIIKDYLAFGVDPNNLYRVTDINGNTIVLDEDDDDDIDEDDVLSSLYFVYRKDEDENEYITVNEMRKTAENLQIFRPLFNSCVEAIKNTMEN